MLGEKNINKKVILALIIHYLAFATLHTIPFITGHDLLPESFYIEALHFSIERWLIWVVPSVILIKVFEKDLYINFKEMFTNKVNWKTLAWCVLPVIFYSVGGLLIAKYTGFTISGKIREFASTSEMWSYISYNSRSALTVPAIPEEMVFRAWMLNILLGKSPSKKRLIYSIIISGIMFVIIHLPTYFYYDYSLMQMLREGLSVFVIGSTFAIIFYKSKNILLPIFAHWLIDFVAFTFFS